MKLFFFLLIFAPVWSSSVYAEIEVKNLYEVDVLAKSRSNTDRKAAMQQALTRVLGSVLSNGDDLNTPVVSGIIEGAEHYVRQFQYAINEAQGHQGHNTRLMRVLFDEQQLVSILRANNLGIWSEIRPQTLIWLIIDDNTSRHFFHPESYPTIESSLTRAAKRKALPVIFPILDLHEQQLISASEVLSNDPSHLLFASDRYDVVSVLAGRLSQHKQCWKAEWVLHFDEQIHQWVSDCAPLDQITLHGIQGTYNVLSGYYGVKPGDTQQRSIRLKIKGMQNTQEITRLINYLQSLDMISKAKWISVDNQHTIYALTFKGNQYMLAGALTKGNMLQPVTGTAFSRDEMIYHYVSPPLSPKPLPAVP